MPAVFEQSGLRFEYPENWSLEESSSEASEASVDQVDQVEQVVVSSPHTAFWHLSRYTGAETELEGLFDEALAALRSEYPDMETEPAHEQLEGHPLLGFNVNFICLDLTNTCWLRGFHFGEASYLLLCQAEDREFIQVAPVFQAMLASLLRHLK